jgi:diguanylate cyclase (GGDEF)-like protein
MPINEDLYIHEKNVINRIEQFIENTEPDSVAMGELNTLFKEYKKLFKISKKIIRLGDLYQQELKSAQEQIERQNQTLTEKNNELEQKNRQIAEMARSDSLTGLDNRHTAYELFSDIDRRETKQNSHISIIMCDIDYFKKINDTYGHDCGDEVLKCVAGTLKNHIRQEDSLIRWGGEEFLIVLQAADVTSTAKIAEMLRIQLEDALIMCGENQIHVTGTFGVSSLDSNQHINIAITKADKALYKGKKAGRNQVMIFSGE